MFSIRLVSEKTSVKSALKNHADQAQWLSVHEVSQLLGIRQRDVRTMLAKNELVAVRHGENNALMIHSSQLIQDGANTAVLSSLKGTFTMLSDAGFSDSEKLAWLLEENHELGSAPITALRQGRVHSVRRAILTAGI